LESIPGVGPKSIELLYSRFKSVEGIKLASMEELSEEIGRSRAKAVKGFFKGRIS
jgi:excinuclease ABC subunit C